MHFPSFDYKYNKHTESLSEKTQPVHGVNLVFEVNSLNQWLINL